MERPDFEDRRASAGRIIGNPHPYYVNRARQKHSEPSLEWILRTLIDPFRVEKLEDGRELYWGAVPEVENWLLVIVQDGQLFNAFFNRRKRREWGRPR